MSIFSFNRLQTGTQSAGSCGSQKKHNSDLSAGELLTSDHFQYSEVIRLGYPHKPTCASIDPVGRLLAIGNSDGCIRIYGKEFVDVNIKDGLASTINFLAFLPLPDSNESRKGNLLSIRGYNTISLWDLTCQPPVRVCQWQLTKERYSAAHLSQSGKILYMGTEGGNVYVISAETLTISKHVIYWNKAVGPSVPHHPGAVVVISTCPSEPSKLYLAYSQRISQTPQKSGVRSDHGGILVRWNMSRQSSEYTMKLDSGVTCLAWNPDGKTLACGHVNGTYTIWALKAMDKPLKKLTPHENIKVENTTLGPIQQLIYAASWNGEPRLIVLGGVHLDEHSKNERSRYITFIRKKVGSIRQLDSPVVSLLLLQNLSNARLDTVALIAVLEDDIVVIDPKYEDTGIICSPHSVEFGESPVTFLDYMIDPNVKFYGDLMKIQRGAKTGMPSTTNEINNGNKSKMFPLNGGKQGDTIFPYFEMMITGQMDGQVVFWDCSALNLSKITSLSMERFLAPKSEQDKWKLSGKRQTGGPKDNKDPVDHPSSNTSSSSSSQESDTGISGITHTLPYSVATSAGLVTGEDIPVSGDDHYSMNYSHYCDDALTQQSWPNNRLAVSSVQLCQNSNMMVVTSNGGHATLFEFNMDKADPSEGMSDIDVLYVPGIAEDGKCRKQLQREAKLNVRVGCRRAVGYHPVLVCLLAPDAIISFCIVNEAGKLLFLSIEKQIIVIDYANKNVLLNSTVEQMCGSTESMLVTNNRLSSASSKSADHSIRSVDHSTCVKPSSDPSPAVDSCQHLDATGLSKASKDKENPVSPDGCHDVRSSMGQLRDDSVEQIDTVTDESEHYHVTEAPSTHDDVWTHEPDNQHLDEAVCPDEDRRLEQLTTIEKDKSEGSSDRDSDTTRKDHFDEIIEASDHDHQIPENRSNTLGGHQTGKKHHRFISCISKVTDEIDSRLHIHSTVHPKDEHTRDHDVGEGPEKVQPVRGRVSFPVDSKHDAEYVHTSTTKSIGQRLRERKPSVSSGQSKRQRLLHKIGFGTESHAVNDQAVSGFLVYQQADQQDDVNPENQEISLLIGRLSGYVGRIHIVMNIEGIKCVGRSLGEAMRLTGPLLLIDQIAVNAIGEANFYHHNDLPVSQPDKEKMIYMVFVSVLQAKVQCIPNGCCNYESAFDFAVFQTKIISFKETLILCAMDAKKPRIHFLSLPRLEPLANFSIPMTEDYFLSKGKYYVKCTNKGHIVYMPSPTEIQKANISASVGSKVTEMMPTLYPGHHQEQQQQLEHTQRRGSITGASRQHTPRSSGTNLFWRMFSSAESFDESEMFESEQAKEPAGFVKLAGQQHDRANVGSVAAKDQTSIALQAAMERGENLSKLAMATAAMSDSAHEMQSLAHQICQSKKQKSERWWPFHK